MKYFDYLVVGGGMLGSAIGYGLVRDGLNCAIIDGDDRDFRAARGNFGLIWVQGKGATFPEYAHLTLEAARLWPEFTQQLQELTGTNLQYHHKGGITYCLTDAALGEQQQKLEAQVASTGGEFSYKVLNNKELRELEPAVSEEVPAATWSPWDGHVNPLLLLRAMNSAFAKKGGHYQGRSKVSLIEDSGDEYLVYSSQGQFKCKHLILCAGLENERLAPMVGLKQPVFAQRGQVLITARVPKLLNYPASGIRQTAEGTVQIGLSKESVGLDDGQTVEAMAMMAQRACNILPDLRQQKVVRGWGALRVLTQDGYPVYEKNDRAWAFSSHSGVTLAPVHALKLSQAIKAQDLGADLLPFTADRF